MNKWDFIDWEETQRRFNYASQKLKAADRVLVRCYQCNIFVEVRYDSVRGRGGKLYKPVCKSCSVKKQWENQEYKQNIAAKASLSMQKVWNNEEYVRNQQEKHKIAGKLKWQDDEYRAKVKSGVRRAHANNPEYTKSAVAALRTEKAMAAQKKASQQKRKCKDYRRKLSEASKNNWNNPKYRKRMLSILKSEEFRQKQIDTHSTPEYKEKAAAIMRSLWEQPEYREKMITTIQAMWNQPEFRSRMTKMLSDSSKHLWENEEYRKKHRKQLIIAMRTLWNQPKFRNRMTKIISNNSKRLWENEEYRENQIDTHSTPEYKEKAAAIMRSLWEQPEYREKMITIWNQPEYKERMSKIFSDSTKHLWENEEYREQITTAMKALWDQPEYKERMSKILSNSTKRLWENEEYREKMVATIQALWDQPEFRNRMGKILSDSSKHLWENEEYREKMIAIHNTPEYKKRMAIVRANMPRISSIQLQLYKYLDDLDVEYCKEGTETAIGYYAFDCLIPKQNKMHRHLLIECQGDYWHSLPKAIRNDKSKFTYINRYFPEHEIIYVWEHEFYAKDRVLDRLKLKLGIDIKTKDFDFKNIELREVSSGDIKSFLDAYHYIGKGRGGKCFGAYYRGELIACMVFSPPLRQNTAGQFDLVDGGVRELSRLCIHPSYHKKNFASWFISKAVKNIKELVVAYADTTVGHTGTIYKASNFKLHHTVVPDYWYVDIDGFVMHKKTLYQRAKTMSMKESDFAKEYGYHKKWGGKKFCFIYAK